MSYKEFEFEENPFPYLYFDITYRCNMKCSVCYNPIKPIPDMNLETFEDQVSRLPTSIEIHLIGGEPTIHPDFFEFIKIVHKYGHDVYFSTNGVKFAQDLEFCKQLKEHYSNGKIKIHLDVSGGYDLDVTKKIFGHERYHDIKMRCLENFVTAKVGRVTISMMLIRGLNEHVMGDMFKIAEKYNRAVREVSYRSQGDIGRYLDGRHAEPYQTNDWLRIMMEKGLTTSDDLSKVTMAGFLHFECQGKNCCYFYRKTPKLTVSWVSFGVSECWVCGQAENGKTMYMFESLARKDKWML